jgi:hypothetical protein
MIVSRMLAVPVNQFHFHWILKRCLGRLLSIRPFSPPS